MLHIVKSAELNTQKDMLHLGYRVHLIFGLQKEMLHLVNGTTGYIWVKEGHVTFGLQKDMLHPFMTVTIPSCPQGLDFQGALAT